MTTRSETLLGGVPDGRFRGAVARLGAARRCLHLDGVLICARAPVLLTALMVVAGLVTSGIAGTPFASLLRPYYLTSLGVSSLAVVVATLLLVLRFAVEGEVRPFRRLVTKAKSRGPYLLMPILIVPLFLASFTATKSSIPYLVGFDWEAFWANADSAILGQDAWKIAHALLGDAHERSFEFIYAGVWGFALILSFSFVALTWGPRRLATFYTAMFATWFVAGFAAAYAFSAAGPVFAPITDPNLAERFGPLTATLASHLTPHGLVQITQQVLEKSLTHQMVVLGGGVSAMPSMHLAVAMIFVMATRGTRWSAITIPFWGLIFVLSAYFGYHYWIDGIAGSIIASLCWLGAERLFEPRRVLRPPCIDQLRRVLAIAPRGRA
jgi:hypothetical protein